MSMTDRVNRVLRHADLRKARRGWVAWKLFSSESAVRRGLHAEGTRFMALVSAERQRRIDEMPEKRGKQVFEELGFSELGSFYRWYKTHNGCSWSESRRVSA